MIDGSIIGKTGKGVKDIIHTLGAMIGREESKEATIFAIFVSD